MYHAAVYGPMEGFWHWESPALSLPSAGALPGDARFDVAIIGGGLTGISAAYHLAKASRLSVCVLEAGAVGRGASGLNGGFCNVSPTQTLQALLARYGDDDTKAFLAAQYDGVRLVRNLLSEEAIEAQPVFGGTSPSIASWNASGRTEGSTSWSRPAARSAHIA